jgi:hypothetical protein
VLISPEKNVALVGAALQGYADYQTSLGHGENETLALVFKNNPWIETGEVPKGIAFFDSTELDVVQNALRTRISNLRLSKEKPREAKATRKLLGAIGAQRAIRGN